MTSVPSAADYLAAGLRLVAIPRGSKAPKDDGWQLEQNAIRNVEQANLLAGCNIGVAHLSSGTAAVDVDDYLAAVSWLAKHGIALDGYLAADDAVQISSGQPNHCKLWYRLPDGVIWLPTLNLRESYGVGLELRCAAKDGSATVVDVIPPSLDPTGRPYEWKGDWRNPPELPEELLTLWRGLAKNGTKPAAGRSEGGPVLEGGRNNFLASLAGTMRRRDMSETAITAALMAENTARCVPPLPDAEVAQIAKSMGRYAPGQDHQLPPVEVYIEDARRGNGKDGRGGNSDASHHDKHGEAADATESTRAPRIEVWAGELPRIVGDAVNALQDAGAPIYVRGDALYRPVRIEAPPKDSDHVRRPIGAVVLRPVDPIWVRLQLASVAKWVKWNAKGKKMCPTDPSKDVALTVATQADLGN